MQVERLSGIVLIVVAWLATCPTRKPWWNERSEESPFVYAPVAMTSYIETVSISAKVVWC